MVLVARSLPIIIVLVVKPLAHQRHIPRLRVRHFVPQLRSKRLNQSSRAHYVGISREMMLPVKTHRDVAGNVTSALSKISPPPLGKSDPPSLSLVHNLPLLGF